MATSKTTRKPNRLTHGEARKGKTTAEYRIWCAMLERCSNPHNQAFYRYGGRGISVCERWLSYENFLTDMGRRQEGLSLDRIDNDGNYEPGNVRWATAEQQGQNKGNNRLITFSGVTLTMSAWGKRLGFSANLLSGRINKNGWSIERALTTPIKSSTLVPLICGFCGKHFTRNPANIRTAISYCSRPCVDASKSSRAALMRQGAAVEDV